MYSKKCIRPRKERVKMVLGLDVGMDKVEKLCKLALVGIFVGNMVKGEALRQWMDEGWR
jgi:hypothetical protein